MTLEQVSDSTLANQFRMASEARSELLCLQQEKLRIESEETSVVSLSLVLAIRRLMVKINQLHEAIGVKEWYPLNDPVLAEEQELQPSRLAAEDFSYFLDLLRIHRIALEHWRQEQNRLGIDLSQEIDAEETEVEHLLQKLQQAAI